MWTFFLKASDYEIRQYEAAKWVCTSLKTIDWDAAINAGFMKLFNYIKGKNEKGNIQCMHPIFLNLFFFHMEKNYATQTYFIISQNVLPFSKSFYWKLFFIFWLKVHANILIDNSKHG